MFIKYQAITFKEYSGYDTSQYWFNTYSVKNTAHTSDLLLANDRGKEVVKETKVKESRVKSRQFS